MTYSVLIEEGVVTNRIVGTAPGYVENDVAEIGWTYDGETFSPPHEVPQTAEKSPRREGTFREFMALFTTEEADAIYGAAMVTASRGDFTLTRWMDRAKGGPTMRIDHDDTKTGLAALVAAGLITEQRAMEIQTTDLDAVG